MLDVEVLGEGQPLLVHATDTPPGTSGFRDAGRSIKRSPASEIKLEENRPKSVTSVMLKFVESGIREIALVSG